MGNGQTDQQFGNSGVALLLGPPYLSFGFLMHTQRVSFGFLKEDARAVESFVVPPQRPSSQSAQKVSSNRSNISSVGRSVVNPKFIFSPAVPLVGRGALILGMGCGPASAC